MSLLTSDAEVLRNLTPANGREAAESSTKKAAPAGRTRSLRGDLETFSALEICETLSTVRKTGRLTFHGPAGEHLECRLAEGVLASAEMAQLTGTEAVLACLDWTRGTFEFVPGLVAAPLGHSLPVGELVIEAQRLKDELGRLANQVPPADQKIGLRPGADVPADRLGCGVATVARALRQTPGITRAALEAQVPLCPVKVHLSLAVLQRAGVLTTSARN